MTPDRGAADRAAGYGLLASATVALLPYIGHLPWWLSAFIVVLAGWRFFMLRRGWPAPARWIRLVVVLGVAVAIFRQYGTVFGRDAGSALLAAMLALKFLELNRLRDYMLALFLIYLLIAVLFLYSQDVWLVIYLAAVFVATTATLVRLAVPGADARRATRLAAVVLLQALPLMLVMHLLFPRLQGSLWGLPRDAYAGRTGLSEQMRPGSISDLTRSEEVAFRAYFPDQVPAPRDRYWRAIVLSHTDGRTWTPGFLPPPRPAAAGIPLIRYTLVLEPSGGRWVPALEYAAERPDDLVWRGGATLAASRPIFNRRLFELAARRDYGADVLSRTERASALEMPNPGPRVLALARSLRDQKSERQRVEFMLRFFHDQEFTYTLEPPLLGNDPVDEFLFDTRRGFCEHFASAFVVAMRAAGLPARVVTGYQGGEFNPANQSIIVRQSDAHAWAEIWLTGRGWTRVDPTAAVAPERIELGAAELRRRIARGLRPGSPADVGFSTDWLDRLRNNSWLAIETVQSAWLRWVLSYDSERQRRLLSQLGAGGLRGIHLVGLLAIVVAVVIGIYIVVTRPRPRALDPALRTYRRLSRKLARAGVPRRNDEGPVDYLGRAARALPNLAETLGQVRELYIEARYAANPDADRLSRFSRAVRSLKTARLRPAA